MCGIVGYIGPRNAAQVILDGLRRLEYRGYDSAGIAVIQSGSIAIRRDVGKLSNLSNRLVESPIEGNIGIGHTRAGPPTASPASVTPIRTPTSPAGWWWCRTASSRTSASCAPNWRRRASSLGRTPTPR